MENELSRLDKPQTKKPKRSVWKVEEPISLDTFGGTKQLKDHWQRLSVALEKVGSPKLIFDNHTLDERALLHSIKHLLDKYQGLQATHRTV